MRNLRQFYAYLPTARRFVGFRDEVRDRGTNTTESGQRADVLVDDRASLRHLEGVRDANNERHIPCDLGLIGSDRE